MHGIDELSLTSGNDSHLGTEAVVDVIIAAWNRETMIERAITSALADPAVSRVLVVDDASGDKTAKRAESAGNGTGRVSVQRLSVNRGPAAARNLALELSSAPWIAVLDADDYLLPRRFSKLLAWATEWDFIADDMFQIDGERIGIDAPVPLLSAVPFEPWRCDLTTFVMGNISRPGKLRKELGFFKPLMRRAFLEQNGLRYDERLRLGEDYAFYAKALALGAQFVVVPAQGYISVVRTDSLSARHSKRDLENLRDSDLGLAKLTRYSPSERAAIEKHYRSIDARVQWLEVIDAVKARSSSRFTAPFFRSPEVSLFLAARLLEQLSERSLKRLGKRHTQ